MLDKYVKIIYEIKEQTLSIIEDENEGKNFIMGKDFMRLRFKTNNNLLHDQKISVPVCVIPVKPVCLKKENGIIHKLNYKIVFMKTVKIDCFTLSKLFCKKQCAPEKTRQIR